MDWPGSDEISTRLAATLPPQVLQKGAEDLPPEAKAMVSSMQAQMQQLQQERDKAVSLLGDKEADRAIEREKINKDFEASLTKVAADMQTAHMEMVAKLHENNEAQMEKINNDFEAKIFKVVADLEAKRFQTESAERMAEPKQESKLPDIHIHMPSGKKKISKGPDGSYTAEDLH